MENQHNKRKSFIISVVFLLVVIASLFAGLKLLQMRQQTKVGAAPASTMFISPSSQQATAGSDVAFLVKINTGENKITGVDVVVNYDPHIIQVSSLSKGADVSAFDNTIYNSFDNTKGQILYTIFTINRDNGVSGSAVEFLKINAKVKSDAILGKSTLSFDTTSAASGTGESENVITKLQTGEIEIVTVIGGNNVPGEPNSCGGTCGSHFNCQANLYCYNGYCRNPECSNDSDCNCTTTVTSTATPKVTVKPTTSTKVKSTSSPSPKATSQTIILSNATPTVSPASTFDDTEVEVAPENKLSSYIKIAVYVLGAVVVLTLLYTIISYFKNKRTNQEPPVQTPPPTIVNSL